MPWWFYAVVSALAASATAILAKIGVKDVPSNVATAVRTVVVLVFAWVVVFAAREHHVLRDLSRRSVLFLVLSGVATGISWLAYFKALQMAPASRVAPIDKVSLAFTIILAGVILGLLAPCRGRAYEKSMSLRCERATAGATATLPEGGRPLS